MREEGRRIRPSRAGSIFRRMPILKKPTTKKPGKKPLRVAYEGQPLELTRREFGLLHHLMRHPGRLFRREELLDKVWGYDYLGETRTVDVHVRRLRAKLGAGKDLIQTVIGTGYKFEPPPDR